MDHQEIKILLIEDDKGDADYFREVIAENQNTRFEVECVETLSQGLDCIGQKKFDAILLDLNLPDSRGINTFIDLHTHTFETPVVVLTGLDDEKIALQAMRKGAQDFITKSNLDGKMLSRVISYAIERHRMQMVLRSLSIIDELTGLYNRRGFLRLAEHHLELAHRSKKELLLFFVDLDHLKVINDAYGHQEGDQALVRAAEILKETFRSSDIVSRLGGDEFMVLMINVKADEAEAIVQKRLRTNLENYNRFRTAPYELSFSSGTALFDSNKQNSTIEELIIMADKALYEEKRRKRVA